MWKWPQPPVYAKGRITVRLQTKLTFDVVNLHEPIPRTRSSKVEKSLESGLALLISINDTPFLKAQLYPTFSRNQRER